GRAPVARLQRVVGVGESDPLSRREELGRRFGRGREGLAGGGHLSLQNAVGTRIQPAGSFSAFSAACFSPAGCDVSRGSRSSVSGAVSRSFDGSCSPSWLSGAVVTWAPLS